MEHTYKAAHKGAKFDVKTGKLYEFCYHSVSVMVAWPKPIAWTKTQCNPVWTHFRPDIMVPCRDVHNQIRQLEMPVEENGQLRLLHCMSPSELTRNRMQLARLHWFNTIPAEIRELVSQYRKRHWHMLSFLARCGDAAEDLTVSNPALAFALANNWVYHRPSVQRPLRSARALLKPGKKQRDILSWLGFPGTGATRRIMMKIVPKSVNIPALFYIRQSLLNPHMTKMLSHLTRLNAGAIRIVTDPELMAVSSPAFIEEVSQRRGEDTRPHLARYLKDCLNMHQMIYPDGRPFQTVRSIKNLSSIHHELVIQINRTLKWDTDIVFPEPPVEGTEQIVPITNVQELREEGCAQHNCAAAYLKNITVKRSFYLYRVLWPERCTLALYRQGEDWVFYDLKRASNEAPSEMTYDIVRGWLERSKLSTTFLDYLLEEDEAPF